MEKAKYINKSMSAESKARAVGEYKYEYTKKAKGKKLFKGEEEFDVSKYVAKRFYEMKQYRERSCPFIVEGVETDSDTQNNGGGDWAKFWDYSRRQRYMDRDYTNGEINYKSPMTHGIVQSILSKVNSKSIGVEIDSVLDKNKFEAKVLEEYINNEIEKNGIRDIDLSCLEDAIVLGTSIAEVGWIKEKREFSVIITEYNIGKYKDKILLDEGMLKKIEKGLPIEIKETRVVRDHFYKRRIELENFFVTEGARTLEGYDAPARDVIEREIMELEDFKRKYEGSEDPYIDKEVVGEVKGAGDTLARYEGTVPFYEVPMGYSKNSNVVEVLHYRCVAGGGEYGGRYVIRANDRIIRNAPLEGDKQLLPYVIGKWANVNGHFWGWGIPRMIEQINGVENVLMTSALTREVIASNPPLLVDENVFPDMDSQMSTVESGKIIKGNNIKPDSARFMELTGTNSSLTFFLQKLEGDYIIATGLSPKELSVPKNEPVRNNLMRAEAVMESVNLGLIVWARSFLIDSHKKFFNLSVEHITASQESIREQRAGYTSKYLVKLNNKKISKQKGDYSIENSNDSDIIDLSALDLKEIGDIEVKLDLGTVGGMSRNVKADMIRSVLVEIMPLIMNPTAMSTPFVSSLIKEFLEIIGMNKEIISKIGVLDEGEDLEVAKAQNDIFEMISRQPSRVFDKGTTDLIQPESGRSYQHLAIHFAEIIKLSSMLNSLQTNSNIYGLSQEDIGMIQTKYNLLLEHVNIDQLPIGTESGVLLQEQGQKQVQEQAQQVKPLGSGDTEEELVDLSGY